MHVDVHVRAYIVLSVCACCLLGDDVIAMIDIEKMLSPAAPPAVNTLSSSWISFSRDWSCSDARHYRLHTFFLSGCIWFNELWFDVCWRALYSSNMFSNPLLITHSCSVWVFCKQRWLNWINWLLGCLWTVCYKIMRKQNWDLTSVIVVWHLYYTRCPQPEVLSRWHRSDCLIRSHSCTVPERLSPSFFLSSLPLFCHLHLFAFTLRILSCSPCFSLFFCLFDFFWSQPHSITFFFSFSIWTPDVALAFSFPLPLFSTFSQPVGCVIVQQRQTDRVTAEVKGTGWSSTLQVLTRFSSVEAKGQHRPLLVAWRRILSPISNYSHL